MHQEGTQKYELVRALPRSRIPQPGIPQNARDKIKTILEGNKEAAHPEIETDEDFTLVGRNILVGINNEIVCRKIISF